MNMIVTVMEMCLRQMLENSILYYNSYNSQNTRAHICLIIVLHLKIEHHHSFYLIFSVPVSLFDLMINVSVCINE